MPDVPITNETPKPEKPDGEFPVRGLQAELDRARDQEVASMWEVMNSASGIAPAVAERANKVADSLMVTRNYALANLDELEKQMRSQSFDRDAYFRSSKAANYLKQNAPAMALVIDETAKIASLEKLFTDDPADWAVPDEALKQQVADYFKDMPEDLPEPLAFLGGESDLPSKQERIDTMYKWRQMVEQIVAGDQPLGPSEAVDMAFEKNPSLMCPFFSGMSEVEIGLFIATTLDEWEKAQKDGKPMNRDRLYWLIQTARMERAMERRGTSFLGKLATSVLQVPAYAGEFALTSGVFSGVRAGIRKSILGATEEVIKSRLRKAVVEVLAFSGGSLAQSAIRAPIRAASAGIEQSSDKFTLTADEEGALLPVIVKSDDDFIPAFAKALGAEAVAGMAEMSGEGMLAVKKMLLARWLGKHPSVSPSALASRLNKFGWHEVAPEIAEEFVEKYGVAALGLRDEPPPTWEEFLLTTFTVGPFGLPALAAEQRAPKWIGITREEHQTVQALGNALALKEASKIYNEAVITQKSPEAAREMVEQILDGEERGTVYADAVAFKDYAESKGMNPEALATQLTGSPALYQDALKSDASFAIPTHRYMAVLSGTEHAAFFQDDLRIGSPDALNAREAREVGKRMAAEAEAAAKGEVADEDYLKWEPEVKQVEGMAAAMLEDAGFSPYDAGIQARLYAARSRIRAKLRNQSPVELFRSLGLSIERYYKGEEEPIRVTTPPLPPPPQVAPPAAVAAEATAPPPTGAPAQATVEAAPAGTAAAEAAPAPRYTGKHANILNALFGPLEPDEIVDIESVEASPDEYQFKMEARLAEGGATNELAGAKKMTTVLGPMHVQRIGGKTKIVSGHHRLKRFRELGHKQVKVRELKGLSVKEARQAGAIINLIENSQTAKAVDVAYVLKEMEITSLEELAEFGISLTSRSRLGRNALALSRLHPALLRRVITGEMQEGHGIRLGASGLTEDQQMQLLEEAKKRKIKNLTEDWIQQLADQILAAPTVGGAKGLFGDEEAESLAFERAKVASEIRGKLVFAKGLFGNVSKVRSAKALEEAGSKIDVGRAREISEEAEKLLWIFDTLKNRSGPVSEALNKAATKYKGGMELSKVVSEAYAEIYKVLPSEIKKQTEQGELVPETEKKAAQESAPGLFQIGIATPAQYNAELADAAIRTLGTTLDIDEAGFILPDGTMLKFGEAGQRTIQHGVGVEKLFTRHKALAKALRISSAKGQHAVLAFQRETGAVRISSEGGGISLATIPTRQQLEVLMPKYNMRHFGEPLAVDVFDPKTGDLLFSGEVPATVDSVSRAVSGTKLYSEKRGFITQTPEGINIALLAGMDRSTFLHETGHLWLLEVVQDEAYIRGLDPATLTDEQKQFLKDTETLKAFLEIKSLEELRETETVDGKVRYTDKAVKANEKFARGVEAYLMEGEAPSLELKSAFARFKHWLTKLAEALLGPGRHTAAEFLNVQVNEEVMEVLDRLLATQQQIDAAKNYAGHSVMFSDPIRKGMPPARGAAIDAAIEDSDRYAVEKLHDLQVATLRRRRAKEAREAEAAIRVEVEKEFSARPVYKAIRDMMAGIPSPEVGKTLKVGKKQILAAKAASENRLKRIERKYPGIFAEDGIDIDIFADGYGFKNGAALLRAISDEIRYETAVRRETRDRLQRTHPELFLEPTFDDAVEAIHNERWGKVIKLQLEYLASQNQGALKGIIKYLSKRVTAAKAVELASQEADAITNRTQVNQLQPGRYLHAEVRHAREAGKLATSGDWAGSAEEKVTEMLNHELFRSTAAKRKDVEAALRGFKKILKPDDSLSKGRDMDIVYAARAVLAAYKIGGESLEKSSAEYLDKIREYDPKSYEILRGLIDACMARAKNYRESTYADFKFMATTVNALWDFSRESQKVKLLGKETELAQVVGILTEQILKVNGGAYRKAESAWEKMGEFLLDHRGFLVRCESWCIEMDAGNPDMPFQNFIYRPISQGASDYRRAYRDGNLKFQKIWEDKRKELSARRDIDVSEYIAPSRYFDGHFKSLAELIHAILHSGSESGLSKMLRGNFGKRYGEDGKLDTTPWERAFSALCANGTITPDLMDRVERTWKLMEEYFPQAQRVHKEMHNVYAKGLTFREVVTPWKTYSGGYAPAVVDYDLVPDESVKAEPAATDSEAVLHLRAATADGFMKERVDAYAQPLKFDLRTFSSHIEQVTRYIHLQPAIHNVNKVVHDRYFAGELGKHDKTIRSKMLLPWLERAASQQMEARSRWSWGNWKLWRKLRANSGMGVMFGNVANTMQQYTGLSLANVKVDAKYLASAAARYYAHPIDTAGWIDKVSGFMQTSSMTQVQESQRLVSNIMENVGPVKDAVAWIRDHAYFLQSLTQGQVNRVTWLGAYYQALDQKKRHDAAVLDADSAVRQTQGAYNPEDISLYESGSPFERCFTQFTTYFNMKLNLQGSEFIKLMREGGLKENYGKLMHLAFFSHIAPAIVSGKLMRLAIGLGSVKAIFMLADPGDDDEMSDLYNELWVMSGDVLRESISEAPFGQTLTSAVDILRAGRGFYDDRLSISPIVQQAEASLRGAKAAVKFATGQKEELTGRNMRDIMTGIGFASGIPVINALGRPVAYLVDVGSGKKVPVNEADLIRGVITGR